jgi:hypothetical protein
MALTDDIEQHCSTFWGMPSEVSLDLGPIRSLFPGFRVLKFPPTDKRNSWTYATCGMSGEGGALGLEVFIIAPTENDFLAVLLSAVAHYHASGEGLGLGHTVNFGCPWYDGSPCSHALLSLPYLDGPGLEWLPKGMPEVRFLWLIPITEGELAYKKARGVDALEDRFEESGFSYNDPFRESVV